MEPDITAIDGRKYTAEEVADMWQCSVGKIRKEARNGRLGSFFDGKSYRFSAAHLAEYEAALERPRTQPVDPAAVVSARMKREASRLATASP